MDIDAAAVPRYNAATKCTTSSSSSSTTGNNGSLAAAVSSLLPLPISLSSLGRKQLNHSTNYLIVKVDFESSPHSKVPEYNLHASFLKTFDDKYSLEDIGKRLYTGIEQNTTDWRLATIVVNYWRVSGDARQAFNCLELAMENSPEFHEKVILVNAANILYRINKLEAALEIAHKALQYPDSQNWIVIPFLVANIFARMDQWHKATLFYEICLSLKADFEEAIYRIKSIQCQQMVLQNLEQH